MIFYIDGLHNKKNVNELVEKYLNDVNAAFHNHNAQPDYDKEIVSTMNRTILMFGERNMKITPERGMKN